jgi:hypothetical protein
VGVRRFVQRVLLGSSATFRNRHRDWLYLGFLLLIVAVLVVARCHGKGS